MFHANLIHLPVHNSPTTSGIILETALSRRGCNPSMKDSNIAISVGELYVCVCSDSQEMQLLINDRETEARSPVAYISILQNHLSDLGHLNAFILLQNPILFPGAGFLSPCCSSLHELCLCHLLAFGLLPDARLLAVFTRVLLSYSESRVGGVYISLVMTFLFKCMSEALYCTAILLAKSQLL